LIIDNDTLLPAMSASTLKETILETSSRVLTTLGASEESTRYIKERMGTLLDTVETRITGVPQIKDVEQLWYEAYKLKLVHDEAAKRKFQQEAMTRGVEHMPGNRFTVESEKLAQFKAAEVDALGAYNAAVDKASVAQAKIEQARKKA
jgi:hypothetical protein